MWVYARQTKRARFGPQRVALYAQDVYTSFVRSALYRASAAPDGQALAAASPAKDWSLALDPSGGKIVGICLARPTSVSSLLLYVGRQQRHVQDYWQMTAFNRHAVMFAEFLVAASLEVPQAAYTAAAGFAPKGVFTAVTRFTKSRCMEARVKASQQTVQELLVDWRNRFNAGRPFCGEDPEEQGTRLGICMPTPHAILCCCGAWSHWGFPLTAGRQGAGLGLHLIRSWLPPARAIPDPSVDNPDDGLHEMSADFLQGLADIMRVQVAGGADMGQVQFYINWVQRLRDSMLRHQYGMSQRIYDLGHMIHCMLLSGLLSHRDCLYHALAGSIKAMIKEEQVQNYYLSLMSTGCAVPSQSVLYRHRLTMHLAYCCWAQAVLDEMLQSGGVVRFGTVDTSPQGSHDWLMAGFCTMKKADLSNSFLLANRLHNASGEGEDADVAGCADAIKTLAARLELVPAMPTVVGSGRASLAAKLHCLTHACKMTAKSWRACAAMINSTITWTGDLGTEAGIVEARADLTQLFGQWIVEEDAALNAPVPDAEDAGEFAFQAEHAPPGGQDGADGVEAAYRVDCSGSILVPGVLHIMHNATSDMERGLSYWSTFVGQLRHVARMLAKRWSRDRLVATCFSRPPHSDHASAFNGFSATVYEGRWGEALRAVSDLAPLQRALQRGWDLQRFNFGNHQHAPREGDEEGQFGVKLTSVNEAIDSNLFWGYLNMIDVVGQVIMECMAWCEGCSCHDSAGPTRTRHQRVVSFRSKYGVDVDSCPMKTRRAPEMACNALQKFLRGLFQHASPLLLALPCIAALSEQERGIVVRDFEQARQHLHMVFVLKLSHWRQLPWVLMGVAHPEADSARSCSRRALSLFSAAPPEVRNHPVVRKLCAPSSPLRADLQRFANHEAHLSELPRLMQAVAAFRFVPIAERWVESLHASAKKHLLTAPHYSPVHLAWKSIQTRLRHTFSDQAAAKVTRFAGLCNEVKNPLRALKRMGFWRHPGVQSRLQSELGSVRGFSRHLRPWAVQLLYHADMATIFQDRFVSLSLQRTCVLSHPDCSACPRTDQGMLRHSGCANARNSCFRRRRPCSRVVFVALVAPVPSAGSPAQRADWPAWWRWWRCRPWSCSWRISSRRARAASTTAPGRARPTTASTSSWPRRRRRRAWPGRLCASKQLRRAAR